MPGKSKNSAPCVAWFPHPAIWILIVVQWLIILFASWRLDFAIHPMPGWEKQVAVLAAALAGGWLARERWPNITRAAFGFSGFYLSGLGIVALSYLVTFDGARFALFDDALASFDRFLGLDWKTHIAWVNAHPMARDVLVWGYGQIAVSMIFALAALLAARDYRRLADFFILMFASSAVMILLAWLFPAIGPYTHLAPDQASIGNMPPMAGRYWLPHFTALRAHLMTSVTLGETTGLIAFPSFHATAAIITSWAVWRKGMFWPLLVMNAIMLVSTLSIGGHYLADVVASAGIFTLLLALLRRRELAGLTRFKRKYARESNMPPAAGEAGL
jgi:membrane-associated phospholipid phosphatase